MSYTISIYHSFEFTVLHLFIINNTSVLKDQTAMDSPIIEAKAIAIIGIYIIESEATTADTVIRNTIIL